MRISKCLPMALMAIFTFSAQANVALPRIFGDHMVLQRDGTVPIWGTAAPGEAVSVTAGTISGQATAGADGKWIVKLAGLSASSVPIDVTVTGKNTITFHDVLIGDVWICGGQSNMEYAETAEISAKDELPKADHPEIRLFYVPKVPAKTPVDEIGANAPNRPLQGSWQVCSADTLSNVGFSAVGYVFGREINAFTHAPVGLVSICWNGMPAAPFTSLEALQANPLLKGYADVFLKFQGDYNNLEATYQSAMVGWPAELEKWKADNKDAITAIDQWKQQAADAAAKNQPPPPSPPPIKPLYPPVDPANNPGVPTVLYNGMVHPVISYAIKGVIWYQGESNSSRPVEYRTLFPAMIQAWRTQGGQGDFPFVFVQLANYMKRMPDPSESNWAALREAQTKTLSLPKTGMAVAIDIGEAATIHPMDKEDVGRRLALAAENLAYGHKVEGSGPLFKSMTITGGNVEITFDHVGQGLVTGVPPPHFHPGETRTVDPVVKGFAMAGDDRKFVWAKAAIAGDKIVVSSETVPTPVAVRYAWADNPETNLYNKDGLPAVPFRTDDWPVGEQAHPTATPSINPPAPLSK